MIVSDWFQGYHGAERVDDTMRAGLAATGNSPDIVTFSAACEVLPDDLCEAIVKQSRLARLPGVRQLNIISTNFFAIFNSIFCDI